MVKKRRLERGIAGLLVAVMLLTMVPLSGVPPVLAQGTAVFINEIHYDNDGTDANEGIEVAGPAGTDLTGWSLVLYNGSTGEAYNTRDLSGVLPDQENGFGTAVFFYAVNGIQNGEPDGLALVGPGAVVVQFLSYEGAFTAVDGPAAGMTSTDIGVDEPGTTPPGESLQLVGEGSVYEDFDWNEVTLLNTFGTVNTGQTFEEVLDTDNDGVPDDEDNCPATPNPGQEDGDGDGIGDACDSCPADPENDADGDGICGDVDNCPSTPNSGQEDADGDGLGDACDSCPNDPENDIDADGVCGDVDNCPYVYNPGQEDGDGDGIGDACEAPLVPIYDIQYTADPSGDSPYAGDVVTTEGIVTAVIYNGYWIEDAAGGPWNGLWVYDSNVPSRGDFVQLTGEVAEYNNLTELINVSEFAVVSSGNPLPAPVVLSTMAVNDEQYEGVLVRVENATVTDPALGYGEWSVSDGSGDVVIDDKGSYTYAPALDDTLAYIIGPLDYTYGAFKIQPRDDEDIALAGPDYTPIYDIQYTADPSGDSPLAGEVVTTEGIVTAVIYNGYWIEDAAGGAWNGLWVYDSNVPSRGDLVRLTGEVAEYNNLTELINVSEFAVLSSGNALPAPVVLSTMAVNDEQYEGVLVRVENATVTDPALGYGEWSVSDGSGDVVIDDKGSYTYAPALGDTLAYIVGPLDYTYGAFKIQPRDDEDIALVAPPPPLIINEVDSDTPSYDELEFIELYDGGVGNSALDGLVVVLFNGSDDASYLAFDLDGYTTDAGGYFVIGTVAGADIYVDPGDYGWLQNGADAVALYNGDASDFPNDTPVTTDNLLDAIVYDTNDGDDAALLVLLNAGQPQVNEDGSDDKDNHSNQRCPNGEGGARNTDTYTQFVATPGAANCELPPPPFIINEVDSDTPSYDNLEFIELYDGGVGGMALDGLVVVLFNGSDDASYLAFDLDGFTTDAAGYFVIGSVAEADIYVDPGDYGWLQNGADAVALYIGDADGFPNDTPVTTDNLLDAIVYDTNDGDDAALLILLNEGQPQVNEDGMSDKDNHSNQRCPNGEGGARNTDTYTQSFATPGWANCEPPPEACGDPFTAIYAIQGSGPASPLDGTEVSTEGIVVGDFQDGKSGYYIQDAVGDGDPATSDGIFVYGYNPDVNVGDHVRVRGYVDEYYDLTEITNVSQVWSCSTGNSVAPTPLSLPVADVADFEAYEGMLVTFPQVLTISEYYAFGRYGEIVLTTDRQFQPTAVYDPGSPEAATLLDLNLRSRIKLDDGRSSQNPDPAIHPNGNVFDLTNLFRGGDTVQNATGVVDYNYGEYKLQPTQGADYTSVNLRADMPDDVGGNLTVAAFNVLNYFTTLDEGDDICGPSGDMECRGADTAEEFERQRTKIIAALVAMDADVVGLIEIENNEYEAVDDLVSGLNDAMASSAYAYVDTGYIGTDAIKVAFIYKPATVSLVGGHAILDSSVDSRFIDTKNRPVLAQTFVDNITGGIFTVAVNHLKSKGSPCDDIGDPDLGDGAGNCNLTRTAAAEAMVDWLAADPTGSGDADFLIIGDLNSYDKEDPIDALLAGGYIDLNLDFLGEYAYSYVFDGQLGYLDYALASAGLADEVSGATVWHINADEPNLIDYDMTYKKDAQDLLYEPNAFRASDHDPVIAGLNVCDEIPPTAEIRLNRDTLWPPNHRYVVVRAHVDADDNWDPDPTVTLVSVTSNQPDNGLGDGDKPNDILIINDYTFKLRAERSGGGGDRVYTITYQVTDDCGNATIATATVTVRHDWRKVR